MTRLLDLSPVWVMRDGRRIGFTFVCPTRADRRQSCFPDPPQTSEQIDLFEDLHGENAIVQPCNPAQHWQIAGGIENADLATVSVTPSLDGSAAGLWHGFITNGEVQ